MPLKCRCGTWTNNGIMCVNCIQISNQNSDEVNHYPEEYNEELIDLEDLIDLNDDDN